MWFRNSPPELEFYLRDHRQDEFEHCPLGAALNSSCSEEIDDALDGGVGAAIGGFEPAGGTVLRVWLVMEAAVGERPAEALVEEQEEQGHLDAFLREAVGVA